MVVLCFFSERNSENGLIGQQKCSYKNLAKHKTRGSGVPRPKRLGIGSERAFSTSRVLSAGSVEVWTARRAGAKRGRILEDSGRHA